MRWLFALVGLALAGCFQSAATTCSDGTVCPPSKVCAPAGDTCVDPAMVAACDGRPEADDCMVGLGMGKCRMGVCIPETFEGCGDGRVTGDELCDDGNTESGDGCRADCQKMEMCGDGIVDTGEKCDDGNDNAADACDACGTTQWTATSILGSGVDALQVGFRGPYGVAIDAAGNIFIADLNNQRVRRVDALTHQITTVAGNGTPGNAGDGGDATSANLFHPSGVAVDGLGNLYIADSGNNRIRKVDARGIITTVAGTGSTAFGVNGGDGTAAILATLHTPSDVKVDGFGTLYIADTGNHRIRKVTTNGVITTICGAPMNNTPGFTDGVPSSAQFNSPIAIAINPTGTVYIADRGNNVIRSCSESQVSTIVGNSNAGGPGLSTFNTTTVATQLHLDAPEGVAVVTTGGVDTVYFSDSQHNIVYSETGNGLTIVVGQTNPVPPSNGVYDGEGTATQRSVQVPRGLAVDAQKNLFIADSLNSRVRRITSSVLSTVAGNGTVGFAPDGSAATATELSFPSAAAYDALGRVYISDTNHNKILRIEPDGSITTIAGTGAGGNLGDGGPAIKAQLNFPRGIVIDATNNIYVAEQGNHRIRRIDANGTITTYAGTGFSGVGADGVAATASALDGPFGLALSGSTLYFTETGNNRVRKITGNIVTTIAGDTTTGSSPYGDGAAALSAQLSDPRGVAIAPNGNVVIADSAHARIRVIDAGGTITTLAGTTAGYFGDNGVATSAKLDMPIGIAFDLNGGLLVADSNNHRIRLVASGMITTVAGIGTSSNTGDGGDPLQAELSYPYMATPTAGGGFLIADSQTHRIRKVDTNSRMTTIAGAIDPDGMGLRAVARLADPRELIHLPAFTLFAGGTTGTLQALRTATLDAVAGRYPGGSSSSTFARFQSGIFGAIGGVAYDATTSRVYFTSDNAVFEMSVPNPADPTTWMVLRVIGVPTQAGFFDNASPSSVRFRSPTGLFLDPATRALYIADTGNHVIRKADLAMPGQSVPVTTIAGIPQNRGFFGDGGQSTAAALYAPAAVTLFANNLFIADTGNNRVRRVELGSRTITTVLGDGVAASSGEGSPAYAFPVDTPRGLACDSYGNLFVTSSTTVRMVTRGSDGVADGKGSVLTVFGATPTSAMLSGVVTRCLTGIVSTSPTQVEVTDCAGAYFTLDRTRIP